MSTASTVTVSVSVILTGAEALALAQLMKRIGWHEWRNNSIDEDEAYEMRDACSHMAEGLARVGFAPR